MARILRLIASIIVFAIFTAAATALFTHTLKDDGFIHFLKDHYHDSISGKDGEFVGFSAQVISTDKPLQTPFGAHEVVYYELEYQRYECHETSDSRSCSWKTYRSVDESVAFSVQTGDDVIDLNDTETASFKTKTSRYHNQTKDRRILQHWIPAEQVHLWGLLEGGGLKAYRYEPLGKEVLIVTNDAEGVLHDMIVEVLLFQIFSAGMIIIMGFVLYVINRIGGRKSFLAQNKSSYTRRLRRFRRL